MMAVLIPAVLTAREASRRLGCVNNLKQFGLALHGFHGAFERLPPSSLTQPIGGRRAETWSWQVLLLPYRDSPALIDELQINGGQPVFGGGLAPAAIAGNSRLPGHVCPSSTAPPYSDSEFGWGAETSYKAIGATHLESLGAAFPGSTPPPLYNPSGRHPDGALFPSDRGLRLAEIRDGLSNTLVATETVEPSNAVWTFGDQATLVGLPTRSLFGVCFALEDGRYVPVRCAADASQSVDDTPLMTYLDYPYTTLNRYSRDAVYGPGSRHPGIVNHLFADGNVRGLSVEIDARVYMFLITRAGTEPLGSDDY